MGSKTLLPPKGEEEISQLAVRPINHVILFCTTCLLVPHIRIMEYMNILENVEHCGGEPEQAVNMYMNID